MGAGRHQKPKSERGQLTDPTNPYWIITADTQLGAVHWQNSIRENDYYTAFQNQCRKAAEDKHCLGILGLGDMRERAGLQSKNLGGHNRGLLILLEAKKVMLTLMGNHDFTNPNWIVEMCYPSLKDLTNKRVQLQYGFEPSTTFASHYLPKNQLEENLRNADPENIRLMFLHQSLRELTTSLKQSYDISLETMSELGFGKTGPCNIFLGDLHNYGDASLGNITAAYPGSQEMTDANEGVNGFKSNRIASEPHDYRKFVIHFFPESMKWTPVEIEARPWFRGKAKTAKEADRLEQLLLNAAKSWKQGACVFLTPPKSETERFRNLLKTLPILEARVEEYNPERDEENEEDESPSLETSLNWQENKKSLLELAISSNLDTDALDLLKHIIEADGATHNPKNDVLSAWEKWGKQTENEPCLLPS